MFVPTESELVEAGDPVSASLVALDATTGELRWRQSIYRRESWGGRLAAPPTLVRFEREGQAVDAVALATRRGHLFLLDRGSGEALHPTVLQNGEPVSGLTFTRQTFTPSERQSAADATSRAATFETTPWAPPTVAGTLLFPGVDAGAGWGGAAFEPATQRLILNVQETASILRLLEVPAGFSDRNVYFLHCARCHGADRKGLYEGRADRYGAGGPSLIDLGQRMSKRDIRTVIELGRGSMPRFDGLSELERIALLRYLLGGPDDFTSDDRTTEPGHVLAEPVRFSGADRLPANAPPWGSLVAFDLNAGKPAWQVPLGEYLSSPGLGMGAENTGGAVVTASGLIFVAAATPRHETARFRRHRRRPPMGIGTLRRRIRHPSHLRRGRPPIHHHRCRRRPLGPAIRQRIHHLRIAKALIKRQCQKALAGQALSRHSTCQRASRRAGKAECLPSRTPSPKPDRRPAPSAGPLEGRHPAFPKRRQALFWHIRVSQECFDEDDCFRRVS